jgi:hypothetical protein
VTLNPVMKMLQDRVPITLICDLVSLVDPGSEAINRAERPDRDPIWLELIDHANDAAAAETAPGSAQAAC